MELLATEPVSQKHLSDFIPAKTSPLVLSLQMQEGIRENNHH